MRDRSMALVVRDNKILSVQTHRSDRYINELPGGGIEPCETSEEAALRELKEECGYISELKIPFRNHILDTASREQSAQSRGNGKCG